MTNLALIGIGWWGKKYLKAVKQIDNCRIKYVCAKTENTLRELSSEYIKTTNFQKLFSYSDIDGVIIATPASTHYSIAKEFLNHNFNVLLEKPVVLNKSQAIKLKKIAQKSKGFFMPAHIFLYHGAFRKLLERISLTGKIKYIISEGTDFGPFRSGISCIWEWGAHDISMCLAITKTKPISVAAWNVNNFVPSSHDLIFIRLQFPNQVTAIVSIGSISPSRRRKLTVYGSSGALIFDDTSTNKLEIRKELIFNSNKGRSFKQFFPKVDYMPALIVEIEDFVKNLNIRNNDKSLEEIVLIANILTAAEKSLTLQGKSILL